MNVILEKYQTRKIEFRDIVKIGDWNIKVYTITKELKFQAWEVLQGVLSELPNLLNNARQSELSTYHAAFLIVHEAREGVLILLNWWTGGEMVETEIFFSRYGSHGQIEPSPFGDKALICIWEIEIFAHERKAWITHVLSRPENPDFQAYLQDSISVH